MRDLLALGSVAAFVAIHLFVSRLRFLSGRPRSRWLSLAGGVSVAYVFLHLLPEMNEGQRTLTEAVEGVVGFAEHHVYLIALMGLVVFYGLERLAVSQRRDAGRRSDTEDLGRGVFLIHMASFALYNGLIGYLLLHRETQGLPSMASFALAMALHFLVSDYALNEHHKRRYQATGRWILSAAVLAGWSFGMMVKVPEALIAVLIAFLAGGVILNVMKEELPEERESRFSAFVLGAVLYSMLLIAG